MSLSKILQALQDSILVPVLRTNSTELANDAIICLSDAGFRTIEITMTIPDSYSLIEEWSKKDMLIGAGTVFDLDSAKRCIEAGASFIVSPINIKGMPELCHEHDVICILGAMTPNEVKTVLDAGSDIVKVYPASAVGGPSYIKALLDVFPDTLFMPTGGIKAENIKEYLQAGAALLGAGTSLLDFDAIEQINLAKVKENCRKYFTIINDYKRGE
ncbi:MAG: bifunctional 4-hydroxy-2-oxoglutarate aldolase/2-dehydro-3-deoxy-phosphogluconate aldolase [Clostridiales bacterium]|nr:bifunctional 4-hydroxy-2-oxoglutarate aldolase/2-dehydro-3-deoxy-phosphogluconate aldolase [Clostridiales bacterium]